MAAPDTYITLLSGGGGGAVSDGSLWSNVVAKPFTKIGDNLKVSGDYLTTDLKTLSTGVGLSGSSYDGSTVREFSIDEDIVPRLDSDNIFDGDLTIGSTNSPKNLIIYGDIYQEGDAYETHAEKFYTTKDLIISRDGASVGLGTDEISGIKILLADGENNVIFGTDQSAIARIGWEGGALQAIATREDSPTENAVAYWDSVNNRFETSSVLTFDGTNLSSTKQASSDNHVITGSREITIANDSENIITWDVNTRDLTTDRTWTPTIKEHGTGNNPATQSGIINTGSQNIYGVKTVKNNLVIDEHIVSSGDFQSGFGGSGALFSKDFENKGAYLEVDNLTVRETFSVYELLINQIRATNGALWVSSAVKVEEVEYRSDTDLWRCHIDKDQYVPFLTYDENIEGSGNDLIRAQRFTGTNLYLVKAEVINVVNGAPDGNVDDDNEVERYFEISVTSDSPNDPEAGMEFVRIGNTANKDRQGALYLTSDDTGAPFMDVIDDVDSHDGFRESAKNKARLGKLEGILVDGKQLEGYGLYSSNIYLTGSILVGDLNKNGKYLEFDGTDLTGSFSKINFESESFSLIAGKDETEMEIVSGVGITLGDNDYWKNDKTFSFGGGLIKGTSNTLEISGENATVNVSDFNLSASELSLTSGTDNNPSLSVGNMDFGINVSGTNNGIHINSTNYWYDNGHLSVGGKLTWNGIQLEVDGKIRAQEGNILGRLSVGEDGATNTLIDPDGSAPDVVFSTNTTLTFEDPISKNNSQESSVQTSHNKNESIYVTYDIGSDDLESGATVAYVILQGKYTGDDFWNVISANTYDVGEDLLGYTTLGGQSLKGNTSDYDEIRINAILNGDNTGSGSFTLLNVEYKTSNITTAINNQGIFTRDASNVEIPLGISSIGTLITSGSTSWDSVTSKPFTDVSDTNLTTDNDELALKNDININSINSASADLEDLNVGINEEKTGIIFFQSNSSGLPRLRMRGFGLDDDPAIYTVSGSNQTLEIDNFGDGRFDVNIGGNVSASNINDSNWDTAYDERGSQIDGTGLSWSSNNLNVQESFIHNTVNRSVKGNISGIVDSQEPHGKAVIILCPSTSSNNHDVIGRMMTQRSSGNRDLSILDFGYSSRSSTGGTHDYYMEYGLGAQANGRINWEFVTFDYDGTNWIGLYFDSSRYTISDAWFTGVTKYNGDEFLQALNTTDVSNLTEVDFNQGNKEFRNSISVSGNGEFGGNVTGDNLNIAQWDTAHDRSPIGLEFSNGTLTLDQQVGTETVSLDGRYGRLGEDNEWSRNQTYSWNTSYRMRLSQSGSANTVLQFTNDNTTTHWQIGVVGFSSGEFGIARVLEPGSRSGFRDNMDFRILNNGNVQLSNNLIIGSQTVIDSNRNFTGNNATFEGNLEVGGKLESDDFQSHIIDGKGWGIDPNAPNGSYFEIDNLRVRKEFRTHLFVKEAVRATNGRLYVSDASEVAEEKTFTSGSSTLDIKAGLKYATFSIGDTVLIRSVAPDNTSINNVELIVTDVDSSNSDVTTLSVNIEQGGTVYEGDTIVRTSGATLLLDADDNSAPYMDAIDDGTLKTRVGNLLSVPNAVGYGLWGQNTFLTGNLLVGDLTKGSEAGSSGKYLEYSDGDLTGSFGNIDFESDSFTLTAGSMNIDSADGISIGNDYWNDKGNFQFGGIDGIRFPVDNNVRIGSDVDIFGNLSVSSLPRVSDEGLVGLWRFDNSPLESTERNSSEVIGDFSYIEGISGSAISFNLSNSYVQTDSINDILGNTIGSSDFTISFWLLAGAEGTRNVVIGDANSWQNFAVYFRHTSGADIAPVLTYNGTRYGGGSGTIDYSKDNHVKIIWDSSNLRFEIYVNGEFEAFSSSTTSNTPNFGVTRMGYHDISNGSFAIDELRIFNKRIDSNYLYLHPSGNSGGLISANTVRTGILKSSDANNNLTFNLNTGELDAKNFTLEAGDGGYGNADIFLDSDTQRFSLGDKFKWNDGNLKIEGSGIFSGDITGASGTFGDVELGSSGIGSVGKHYSLTGDGLWATGADITGEITAETGTLVDVGITGTVSMQDSDENERVLITTDPLNINNVDLGNPLWTGSSNDTSISANNTNDGYNAVTSVITTDTGTYVDQKLPIVEFSFSTSGSHSYYLVEVVGYNSSTDQEVVWSKSGNDVNVDNFQFSRVVDTAGYSEIRIRLEIRSQIDASGGELDSDGSVEYKSSSISISGINAEQYNPKTFLNPDGIFQVSAPNNILSLASGGGGGGSVSVQMGVEDLSNADISSRNAGDYLRYMGDGIWSNRTLRMSSLVDTGVASTPSSTEDGFALTWNNSAGEYQLADIGYDYWTLGADQGGSNSNIGNTDSVQFTSGTGITAVKTTAGIRHDFSTTWGDDRYGRLGEDNEWSRNQTYSWNTSYRMRLSQSGSANTVLQFTNDNTTTHWQIGVVGASSGEFGIARVLEPGSRSGFLDNMDFRILNNGNVQLSNNLIIGSQTVIDSSRRFFYQGEDTDDRYMKSLTWTAKGNTTGTTHLKFTEGQYMNLSKPNADTLDIDLNTGANYTWTGNHTFKGGISIYNSRDFPDDRLTFNMNQEVLRVYYYDENLTVFKDFNIGGTNSENNGITLLGNGGVHMAGSVTGISASDVGAVSSGGGTFDGSILIDGNLHLHHPSGGDTWIRFLDEETEDNVWGFSHEWDEGKLTIYDYTRGGPALQITESGVTEIFGTSKATNHVGGSDRRIKSNFQQLSGLDIIRRAGNLYSYEKEGIEGREVGQVAQDLLFCDDLVHKSPHEKLGEMYSLSGLSLAGVAMNGVKELDLEFQGHLTDYNKTKSEVDILKDRVAELEQEIETLRRN